MNLSLLIGSCKAKTVAYILMSHEIEGRKDGIIREYVSSKETQRYGKINWKPMIIVDA